MGPGAHAGRGVGGTAHAAGVRDRGRPLAGRVLGSTVVSAATAIVLLGAALLILFLPPYMHAALDAAGSAQILGVSSAQAHEMSDRTVVELFVGPGTFAFAGPDGRPFYGPDEVGHLRDVRVVLISFLAIVGVSLALVAVALARGWREPAAWAAVGRGGVALAILLGAIGVVALAAFDFVFEMFHRVFFPGGNWAFDPATQRLVQLYPLPFWQLTSAALGVLAIGGGLLTWLVARRRARRLGADTAP